MNENNLTWLYEGDTQFQSIVMFATATKMRDGDTIPEFGSMEELNKWLLAKHGEDPNADQEGERRMSVKMTDGKHVRKIHVGNAYGCGHAFMFAPQKRVNQYAACYEGAEQNLIERIKREEWRTI